MPRKRKITAINAQDGQDNYDINNGKEKKKARTEEKSEPANGDSLIIDAKLLKAAQDINPKFEFENITSVIGNKKVFTLAKKQEMYELLTDSKIKAGLQRLMVDEVLHFSPQNLTSMLNKAGIRFRKAIEYICSDDFYRQIKVILAPIGENKFTEDNVASILSASGSHIEDNTNKLA